MTGWHQGPLCGFALEADGRDPETARLAAATIITWNGTALDGEHLLTADQVPEIAARVAGVIDAGMPLVVYDAPHALTVLDREAARHDAYPFGDLLDTSVARVIDPLVLDKYTDPYRKGSRGLAAACAHWKVDPPAEGKTGPAAVAAMRLAWKIARAYPAIAALPPAALRDLQVKARADQAASYQDYLRRLGKTGAVDGSWPVRPYAEERRMAVAS